MTILALPRVSKAFSTMVVAHSDQTYGERPYWTHPYNVAERLVTNFPHLANDQDTVIMALLHDTLEDTFLKETTILKAFGKRVLYGVKLLTKDPKLDYFQNIDRIVMSSLQPAIAVKWCDAEENFQNDKSHMPEHRRLRLEHQQRKTKEILWPLIHR